MLKFHPNFKSADPKITKASTLDAELGVIWQYQYLFSRHTTPHEIKEWDKRDFNSFKIEYSQIDRLYFFSCESNYDLIVRIKYKDKSDIYVYLTAGYIINDNEDFFIHGSIFISRDVKIFMRIVLTEFWNIHNIYKLLEYDGVHIKALIEIDKHNKIKKHDLRLKNKCYDSIYDNREKLQFQMKDIPKIIIKNIKDMIKFREAQDAYKKIRKKRRYYINVSCKIFYLLVIFYLFIYIYIL